VTDQITVVAPPAYLQAHPPATGTPPGPIALTLTSPQLLAYHDLLPSSPTHWGYPEASPDLVTHDLILQTNGRFASGQFDLLQRPGQAVALLFTAGKGSRTVLGRAANRHYLYLNDTFWVRVNRDDLGGTRPSHGTSSLGRRLVVAGQTRAVLGLRPCPRLNHPLLLPTITRACHQLTNQLLAR